MRLIALLPLPFLLVVLSARHPRLTEACAGIVFLASLLTLLAYALDKQRATRGQRRMPERTLHAMELAGGWPGALLAQHFIRHKNRKTAYQIRFWLIVLLHHLLLGLPLILA